MCWCNRKCHCWRWNFQLLTKCSHTFSEASTVSLKNHRKHASERDGDKDRAQLTGHWLCRCDLFSLLLRLEYHPLDPLTGTCNSVDTGPECWAAGAPWIRQGAAGEWRSGLCTSHPLQELQLDVNFLSGFSGPLLLLLYLTVILLKKTFSINHHRAQETPAERLQDPVLGSSHFWQFSSIPHVLALIAMSSASRLHTAQVTRCQIGSLFYYSWDLIGL